MVAHLRCSERCTWTALRLLRRTTTQPCSSSSRVLRRWEFMNFYVSATTWKTIVWYNYWPSKESICVSCRMKSTQAFFSILLIFFSTFQQMAWQFLNMKKKCCIVLLLAFKMRNFQLFLVNSNEQVCDIKIWKLVNFFISQASGQPERSGRSGHHVLPGPKCVEGLRKGLSLLHACRRTGLGRWTTLSGGNALQ